MHRDELERIAVRLVSGELSIEQFVSKMRSPAMVDLGDARVDLDRRRRCGFPEVVYAEGKTVEVMDKIFRAQLDRGIDVLATRVSAQQAAELTAAFPRGCYNTVGRTFRVPSAAGQLPADASVRAGRVVVVTAGTSDLPVAEEARETALWTGAEVHLVADVGVAGPHRLTAVLPRLQQADAVVVVAGMEGALPSVVGGHVSCPVIAVPTSIGYGASFGGIAALLAMLNSCASNVIVVNIDAGFKGGYVAGLIARNVAHGPSAAAREEAHG